MTTGQTGPGGASTVPPPLEETFDAAEVERAVAQNGLEAIGVRPRLRTYVRDLWDRRAFTGILAVSKARAENQNTYLGQVWSLLSPVLNAAVYVVIFGFILTVGRTGIDNTIAFIVVGVFMFRFFERSVTSGAHSLTKNLNLVRSVKFPRAVLPIAGVLAELTSLLPGIVVMCVISYASGFIPRESTQPISIDAYWLLLPFAILLLWLFSTGCAFLVARWVATTPDLDNLIPHAMRILMYSSGVIFSVDHYLSQFSWGWIAEYQPVAVYLYLVRSSILDESNYPPDLLMWGLGVFWAVAFAVIGFLVFWHGEERYGRD